jgi:hypothetical protein
MTIDHALASLADLEFRKQRWLWYAVTGRGFRDAGITSGDRSVRIEVASEVAGVDLAARLTFDL